MNKWLFLLCFLGATFISSPIFAGGENWQELLRQADSLIDVYTDDSALVLGKMALDEVIRIYGTNDTVYARVLGDYSFFIYRNEHYAEAESLATVALRIDEPILGGEHPDVARLIRLRAIYLYMQGLYPESEKASMRAMSIFRKNFGVDCPEVANCMIDLAKIFYDKSEFSEAMAYFDSAMAILSKSSLKNRVALVQCLVYESRLYQNTDDYARAESLSLQALKIIKEYRDEDPQMIYILMSLSDIYRDTDRLDEAQAAVEKARRLVEKFHFEQSPPYVHVLRELAEIYAYKGENDNRIKTLDEAVEVCRKFWGPDYPILGNLQLDLALCYIVKGDLKKGADLLKIADGIIERSLSPWHPMASNCQEFLAYLAVRHGDYKEGLSYYRRMLENRLTFIQYAFKNSSDYQKLLWSTSIPVLNASLMAFGLKSGSDSAEALAMEMILKGKAIVLDALMNDRAIAICSGDMDLEAELRRHSEIGSEIGKLFSVNVADAPTYSYNDSLGSLFKIRDSLEKDLSYRCSEFRDEMVSRNFTLHDIAAAIPANTVLIEFLNIEPYDFEEKLRPWTAPGYFIYYAVTLDNRGKTAIYNLGKADEIDSLIEIYRSLIDSGSSDIYSERLVESEGRLRSVSDPLFARILAPILAKNENIRNFLISPDGLLNLIPFEGLTLPDGSYAIEKYRFSYLSSGRDLVRRQRHGPRAHGVVIVADPDFDYSTNDSSLDRNYQSRNNSSWLESPNRGTRDCQMGHFARLPSTRQEAQAVASVCRAAGKDEVHEYYGNNASKDILEKITDPPEVLHIATHGYFCDLGDSAFNGPVQNPLLWSGLALAGANLPVTKDSSGNISGNSGVITAYELSGLNLFGTELAVMSACETGVGTTVDGEGVFGLRRALQNAGVKTIIMSMWKVPDRQTSLLMQKFYSGWLSGKTKLEALRDAELELLKDARTRKGSGHPLLWAGFILSGNPK